jgi:hypothetical protein
MAISAVVATLAGVTGGDDSNTCVFLLPTLIFYWSQPYALFFFCASRVAARSRAMCATLQALRGGSALGASQRRAYRHDKDESPPLRIAALAAQRADAPQARCSRPALAIVVPIAASAS